MQSQPRRPKSTFLWPWETQISYSRHFVFQIALNHYILTFFLLASYYHVWSRETNYIDETEFYLRS
jgi:hypothetical protein